MTTLPKQMTDRWEHRADQAPGEDTVYWHMLMRNYPQAVRLACAAQQRLAKFNGLHMTPVKWLHMTALPAGSVAEFKPNQLDQMTEIATRALASIPPITVTLGRILYHPEAIMLGVNPLQALLPIREAAMTATGIVGGPQDHGNGSKAWIPHITICYSTAHQPAAPIISALGEQLPECDIQINALNLVIQHGPERRWDWTTIATIPLAASAMA